MSVTSTLSKKESEVTSEEISFSKHYWEKKKKRTCYPASHLEYLNKVFCKSPYPQSDKQAAIAQELGYTEEQIRVWFQNKRASTTGTRRPRNRAHDPDTHVQSAYQQNFLPASVSVGLVDPSCNRGVHPQQLSRDRTENENTCHQDSLIVSSSKTVNHPTQHMSRCCCRAHLADGPVSLNTSIMNPPTQHMSRCCCRTHLADGPVSLNTSIMNPSTQHIAFCCRTPLASQAGANGRFPLLQCPHSLLNSCLPERPCVVANQFSFVCLHQWPPVLSPLITAYPPRPSPTTFIDQMHQRQRLKSDFPHATSGMLPRTMPCHGSVALSSNASVQGTQTPLMETRPGTRSKNIHDFRENQCSEISPEQNEPDSDDSTIIVD